MKFKRKERVLAFVPTVAMADIAFLLLVFFMVTTIFRLEEGLIVDLPLAEEFEKIPMQKVAHIWIDEAGKIVIGDRVVSFEEVNYLISYRI